MTVVSLLKLIQLADSDIPDLQPKSIMMKTAESEARKALNRLRRATEKAAGELRSLEGALRHVEETDFPVQSYEAAATCLRAVVNFADEEGERLREKILYAGGLEPGRVRRNQTN
ncbi:MAG TPA: hypothetical protein EYN99_02680 [Gemmatimonadetes bacterium]|jgi:hypothetical protein|nr:hypothetical protein [Gemmatimonadota bacterium]